MIPTDNAGAATKRFLHYFYFLKSNKNYPNGEFVSV